MKLLRKVKGKWIVVSAATVLATILMQSAPVAAQEYVATQAGQPVVSQGENSTVNTVADADQANLATTSEVPTTSLATNETPLSSEQSSGVNAVQTTSITSETNTPDSAGQAEAPNITSTQPADVSATETGSTTTETSNDQSNGNASQPNDATTIDPKVVTAPTNDTTVPNDAVAQLADNRKKLEQALQTASTLDLSNVSPTVAEQIRAAMERATNTLAQTDVSQEQLTQAYVLLQSELVQLAKSPVRDIANQPNFPQYKLPLVLAVEHAEKVKREGATPESLLRLDEAVAEGMIILQDSSITDLQRIVTSMNNIFDNILKIEYIQTKVPNDAPTVKGREANEALVAEIVLAEQQLDQAKAESAKDALTSALAIAYQVFERETSTPTDEAQAIHLLQQVGLKVPLYEAVDQAKAQLLEGHSNRAITAFYDTLNRAVQLLLADYVTQQQVQRNVQAIEQTTLKLDLYDWYDKALNEDVSQRSAVTKKLWAEEVAEAQAVLADEQATVENVKNAQVDLEQLLLKLPLVETIVQVQSLKLTEQSQAAQADIAKQLAEAVDLLQQKDATLEMVQQAQLQLERTVAKFPLYKDVEMVDDLDVSTHSSHAKAILHTVRAEALVVLTDLTADDDAIATIRNKLAQTVKKLTIFDYVDALTQLELTNYLPSAQQAIQTALAHAEEVVDNLQATDQEIANVANELAQTQIKLPLYDAIDRAREVDLSTRSNQAVRAFNADLANALQLIERMDATTEQVDQLINALQQTTAKLSLYDAKNEAELAKNIADNQKLTNASHLLEASLTEANAVLQNKNATDNDIRRAVHALTVATNKVPLFAMTKQAHELLVGKLKYTVAALNYRLQLANITLKDPNSTKAAIDQEIAKMQQTIDRIPLYEAKSRAESASRNRSSYSREMLGNAFEQVNLLLAQPIVTQTEMDEVIALVDDVIERVPSYDVLSKNVNEATRKRYGQTTEAVRALDDVIHTSTRLLEKQSTPSKALLDQSVLVENTIAKLPLFSLVHQAENMNTSNKTTSSVRSLQLSIRRARIVLSNPHATPSATTTELRSLQSAIANLKTIPVPNTGGGGNNGGGIVAPVPPVITIPDPGVSTVVPPTNPTTPTTPKPPTTELVTPEIRLAPSQTSPVTALVESISQVTRIFQTEDSQTDTQTKEEQQTNGATATQQAEIQANNTQPYVSLINMVLDTTTIPGVIAIAVVSITGTVGVVLYRRVV